MTIPRFGRVTPVQMTMLEFIGYRITRDDVNLDIPDAERRQLMQAAYTELIRLTGQDFGYDLGAWHEFLSAHDDFGYTHRYAFDGVQAAVNQALSDPDRARLVAQLEAGQVDPPPG